jgi:hypothetical protein
MTTITLSFTGSVKYYSKAPDPARIGHSVVPVADAERLTDFVERVVALDGSIIEVGADHPTNTYIAAFINQNINQEGFYAIVNGSTTGGDIWNFDGYSNVHPCDSDGGALEFLPDDGAGGWQVALRCTYN